MHQSSELSIVFAVGTACKVMLTDWRIHWTQICPDYEGLELGIGEGLLKKAIAQATGSSIAGINAQYKQVGDLGLVAMVSPMSIRSRHSRLSLTCTLTTELEKHAEDSLCPKSFDGSASVQQAQRDCKDNGSECT